MPEKTLTPEGYMPRIVDTQVERFLGVFGAVEIAGTKWCGKTWTALSHAESVSYVDDDLEMALAEPSLMLAGNRPHVIDEWQRAPLIWNTVRHAVDAERGLRGAWLLTGSSTPLGQEGQAAQLHSGAGRIGSVKMHPFTLAESGDSTGEVSLKGLFGGDFKQVKVDSDARRLADLTCRGGWPEALDVSVEDAQLIAREYLRLVFEKASPRHGKNPSIVRKLCTSVARNLGQAPTYGTILADMGEDEKKNNLASAETIADYLGFLRSIYLIEEVPGWVPPKRSRKRVATKPKRYFADPSLPAALLGYAPETLIRDSQSFGLVFENLCMRDLLVYAQALDPAMPTSVFYYRDDSGLEADAVVEMMDGRWAAFEFKLSETKVDAAVESLKRIKKKLCANERAQAKPPEFMCVITGIGAYAREVEEGIYVIPLRALGQ